MTAPRSYQGAHSAAEALQMLRSHVERGWRRPDLVEAFVTIVDRGSIYPSAGWKPRADA
jgi:response regulator RpfG family c-di-GMP phosphodiesterase